MNPHFCARLYAPCGSDLDSLLGELLQRCTLTLEDGHVGLQQVFPFHAFLPGHGTHQNGCVQVLEGHFLLVSGDNLCGQTEIWIIMTEIRLFFRLVNLNSGAF